MKFRTVVCAAPLAALFLLAPVRAEVRSLTVGLSTTCPYGLVA